VRAVPPGGGEEELPDGGAALAAVLEQGRGLGFLGPGAVRAHIEHALGFAAGSEEGPQRFLDLGSGGGVPGLVLAARWPASEVVLLDAAARRCGFLREAVARLGWENRVGVVRARAEEAGRRADLRGRFDLVVARGFGPPPVTAECGAPFLAPGGRLVVSEPPGGGVEAREARGTERWPAAGLALVGLAPERVWVTRYHYRSLVLEHRCPDRFPRRTGVPAKRPLF
jgi:16S rRNA (guanine527-N7)-methyltransferase